MLHPFLYVIDFKRALGFGEAHAIAQEVIDILAVLNALRAAFPPKVIHDDL